MGADRGRRPGWLGILFASVAAITTNLPWIVIVTVICGEPPETGELEQALCADASLVIPWPLAVLLPPCAIIATGLVARRHDQPVLFTVTWISCVSIGLLGLLLLALLFSGVFG